MECVGILLLFVVALALYWLSQTLQKSSVGQEQARHGVGDLLAHDDDAAVFNFTQSILTNPTSAAYAGRGAAYYGKGEYEAALADATAAIELDPSNALAYYLKSVAYARLAHV
jgi:tetratricopeptide (TPR) repeat protein